jgi:1-acyl-sn-glycerol-3-phosphate acyltransferase
VKILARAVIRAAVWAVGVFYRVERVGLGLPDGAVLIVANHPNMLMDPLLAMKAAGRRVRVLAKAPLFGIPLFGHVLRALGTLPVYRVQDDRTRLPRNVQTLQQAIDTLLSGGTVLTFPEGMSHSSPALAPLKAGAARIALEAEALSGWRLGVEVVPMGLTYYRKHRFRSRALAVLGEPIKVSGWRQEFEADRAAGTRSLTEAIERGLRRQTLNLADESDRELVETADLLHARSRGLAGWREREPLQERLPRLQRFAEQFAWLRATDPGRWGRLASSLRSYRERIEVLGSGEADVPPRDEAGRMGRLVLREAAVLVLGLPLAALGTVVWYLAYIAAGLVGRIMKPEIETVATVKFLAALVLYPATYLGWIALAAVGRGLPAAAGVALALPPLGLFALHWQRRREEVWEDVKLFFRILRRPELSEHAMAERAKLAAELEVVWAAWRAERSSLDSAEAAT